jgi:ElaB/YqjD/DUF883 family membrane-anchored ribosome-binding protein
MNPNWENAIMAKADDISTEDLRENLLELRRDFKELLNTVERLAAAQAEDVSGHLREGLRTYADRGEEALGAAREHAEQFYDDLHETVERNPLTAMMIALGLGFLIGLLTRSRS